jgi:hypothetical protein
MKNLIKISFVLTALFISSICFAATTAAPQKEELDPQIKKSFMLMAMSEEWAYEILSQSKNPATVEYCENHLNLLDVYSSNYTYYEHKKDKDGMDTYYNGMLERSKRFIRMFQVE